MKKYSVKGKRWLAAFLAMLMIASGMLSVPISGYAAETVADNLEAAKEQVEEPGEEQGEEQEEQEEQGEEEPTPEVSPEVSAAPTSEETSPTPEESASSEPEQEEEVSPSATPEGEPTEEPEPTPSVSPVPSVEPLVQAEELAYLGDTNPWDNNGNYSLVIAQYSMQSYGMEWNAENVLKILEARMSEDTRFMSVSLCGTTGDWTQTIPVSVWNQMVGLLKETGSIGVSRDGNEDELNATWSINAAVQTSKDVDTSFSYEITESAIKFKGAKSTLPAKYGSCSLSLSAPKSKGALYESLGRFYEENPTCSIYDMSGKKINDNVNIDKYESTTSDYADIHISINDNSYYKMLQNDTEYQITEYLGTIWEGDNGNKGLVIQVQGKSFTENQLLNILEVNKAQGPFTNINIYQEKSDTNIIWKSVTNKAREMLTGQSILLWQFTEIVSDLSPEWTIYNPQEMTADIEVKADIEKSDGVVKFSVNTTEIPAEKVQVGIHGYSYKGKYIGLERMKAILGEESKLLVARKEDGSGSVPAFYRFDYNNRDALLYFEDLTELEAGVQYILSERPSYCGTITETDGWRELRIDNSSGEYTNAELVDMLSLNKKDYFNSVQISFSTEKESGIPKEVQNAAIKRLIEGSDGYDRMGQIEYRYKDSDDTITSLVLFCPSTMEESLDDSAVPKFYAEGNELYFQSGSYTYPAQKGAHVGFVFYKNSAAFSTLKNKFGTAGRLEFTVSNGEDKATGTYSYGVTSKTKQEVIGVSFANLQALKLETKYELDQYRGDIDGDHLYLQAADLYKTQFSVSDIQSIADYYKKKGTIFSHITVDQDYSASKATAYTIPKGMINALREILAEETGELVFCISRGVTTGEESDAQCLQNDLSLNLKAPGEASKDITINTTLTPVANQGVTFKINKSKIEANASQVGLQLYVNPEADLGSRIQSALGDPEENQVIVLKNAGVDEHVYFEYNSEVDGNYSLFFGDIDNWEKDVTYNIVTWKTPLDSEGKPVEFEKGRTVSLKAVHPDYEGMKVTWKSYSSGVVSDISADGEMSILGDPENAFYYSATYVKNKVTYVDYWKGEVKQASIDSISFNRNKLVMVLPDDTDESISAEVKENQKKGYLNVRFNPSTAAVDPAELTWSVDNKDVVKLLTDEKGRETGEFKVCKAGTAVIEAVYPNTEVKASCTIVVQEPLTDDSIGMKDMDDLYAVLNFDKTLADVTLPDGWMWKVPETKLAEYGNAQGYNFPAIYTAKDGRSVSRMLYVRFVKIDSISITALTMFGEEGKKECLPYDVPKELVKGDSIVLGVQYNISNGDVADLDKCREQFEVKWECKNKDVALSEEGLDSYWEDSLGFSVTKDSKKEKKAVTLSLVDKNTNKVIMKASAQISVLNGNLMDWDALKTNARDNTATDEFYFKVPKDDYYKLTFKSSDEKVLKLGKIATKEVTEEDTDYVITTVAYKNLKPGISYLTITAADEAKSSISIRKEWKDVAPKIENDKVTIDKALVNNSAEIVLYADSTSPIDVNGVKLVEKEQHFVITDRKKVVTGEVQKVSIKIEPVNDKIKTSKYKVDLSVPVSVDEQTENHTVKIEVTVKETKPVVTFKQTKKVNLFYTDTEGDGLLTVTAPAGITGLTLTDCDYELSAVKGSDTEYRIQLRSGVDSKKINAKGTLEYKVPGYQKLYTASIKVTSENKAPSIGLSQAKDTLYPTIKRSFSELILTDKTTGERLQLDRIELELKEGNIKLSDNPQTTSIGKNRYSIAVVGEDQEKALHIVLLTEAKATDSLVLNVQEDNWSKALKVTYKISVEVKTPTIELGSKKLVLNKNEELYDDEIAETTVRWKGNAAQLQDPSVRFEGLNKASNQILNKYLVLEYLEEEGVLIARLNAVKLNDVELKTGTYKYKVWVDNVSTTLDINIVDKEAAKCVGLRKAGGNIDVLQRENTALYYNIKLTNLTGTVQGAYLQGTDGDLFEGTINDKGQLQISASDWASLSTKASYKVQPVLIVENEHGGSREVAAPVQTIKVKQGSPKVAVTASGNSFYRQRSNEIVITLNPVLNGQKVEIDDVKLGNYTDQFELAFDSNTDSITLRMKENSAVAYCKAGSKYSLNLMIRYKGRAGNEKDQKAAYTVIVN